MCGWLCWWVVLVGVVVVVVGVGVGVVVAVVGAVGVVVVVKCGQLVKCSFPSLFVVSLFLSSMQTSQGWN